MPYVPRTLAATLRRAARTFPGVLVTGPRQTGKTTLLREEFGASHRYVSLERPDVRDVKATRTPSPRHADNLARWCDLTGARGILACRTDRSRPLGRGIRAVPWHFCVGEEPRQRQPGPPANP